MPVAFHGTPLEPRFIRGQLKAATRDGRLPELFAGVSREATGTGFP